MTAEATETEAVDFLKQLRPNGPWVLTAISPDGPTTTTTALDETTARAFVRDNNGTRNLYYSVNPTRTPMTSKAAKVDIAVVEYLFADLDPRESESPEAAKARYLQALEAHEPEPTAIVDSGNGVQVLWRLDKPIILATPVTVNNAKGQSELALSADATAAVDEVEGRAKALMLALGGKAGTQNVDRILRLPGTTNLPNKKKQREGRVPCVSSLIRFNGTRCRLDQFPAAEWSGAKPEAGDSASARFDIDALPVSDRIKKLIRGVADAGHPYKSRSEAVFAVILAMVGAGCTNEQIEAVFLDSRHPISAHVLDQSQPPKYLARQVAKARKAAADPDVTRLNENHALVIVGDKIAIMITTAEGPRFLTLSAFEHWHANRFVRRGRKRYPLAKYWLKHPQRRQYEGLVFAPGREVPNHYNLWRGLAVEPVAGDCSKFLAHLRDNVCRGDKELFYWVVGWFAQIVQMPDKKIGTSLVLRGKQGTGKTKVGEVIGSLLGEHYALVSDPRFVTGRFNSHLVSNLLLHCDESFWAGDHAAEGKLKDLITGNCQFIEFKGKEPIKVRNHVRLLVTGNPNWLVPAGFEERRFAVLEVGEHHIQDAEYFAAIDAEMNGGGREALLDYLMRFDLEKVDLRKIPKTAALLDQKLSSLDPEKGWWLDELERGELPWGVEEAGKCPARRLFDRYVMHASRRGARRRAIETQIGVFLTRFVPGLRKNEGLYRHWDGSQMIDRKGSIYTFPELAECRAAFAKAMQQDFAWNERTTWETEPMLDPAGRLVF
jgi:Family of unknown function (DUF5906)